MGMSGFIHFCGRNWDITTIIDSPWTFLKRFMALHNNNLFDFDNPLTFPLATPEAQCFPFIKYLHGEQNFVQTFAVHPNNFGLLIGFLFFS